MNIHQMKKTLLLILGISLSISCAKAQSYNKLWIPDTLSGTTFNLTATDTFKQICKGNQTVTAGYNGNWWGPTMIWKKGTNIQLNVKNKLQDSTTVHWHGMHLAAIMDGGPHQIVPPKTLWSPYFKVANNAGTYWYHPHLHMEAEKQLTAGLGGLIIIRDSIESALALPRTYGVDDIPLVLTDRKFNTNNQLVVGPYGDSMMANGTLRAQVTLPAQVVRFRVLDAALERSYNIGFSDNRSFYVITSDGGLLDAPVAVTRYLLSVGERIEILVDLSNDKGKSINLMSYNSGFQKDLPGSEGASAPGGFSNFLGAKDFNVLNIQVGAATANPITKIPTTLTKNTFWAASSANLTRTINLQDSFGGGAPGPIFKLDNKLFNFNLINQRVKLDNTEIWEIKSTSGFSHPFHIHDVEFYVLDINGAAAPNYQQGWKDVIMVRSNTTVRFIAKFSDFADADHPFMYHCHIAKHEDDGLMAQFVVQKTSSIEPTTDKNRLQCNIYPNPAGNTLYLDSQEPGFEAYYVTVMDITGRTYIMLPKPQLKNGIDISSLHPGTYLLKVTNSSDKRTYTGTFIKK